MVPLTEIARAQVGADVASERYGLSGAGTMLCAIDTGLDPAFTEAAWWLDVEGEPRGAYAELEESDAVWRGDDLIGVPGDPHGHGTAMISIARAIAPDASVIVV